MENKGSDHSEKLTPVEQLQEKPTEFLIVGIGASAGGINALQEFFKQVPENSNIAYVVILHLSPDHDSQLASVLQHQTQIPVVQVIQKTIIKPDHIYVVPPNRHLTMEDGYIAVSPNLHLEERRAPVDIFFRTLADQHGPRAISVILSGTGANGSMGLKRIKERGGATYVQNPREAEFNEMPRNAIATELVDEVLNVGDIPARIIAYRNSMGTVQIVEEAGKRPEPQQQALREIFTQLRVRTGHDFSNYKRPTLLRRIERRINVHNLPDLPSYTDFLHEHPDETHALLKDLLISVTNFFRDSKAFNYLEQDVLPAIFSGKTSADQIRIWVAGCATGEEAYSVAMLCAEQMLSTFDTPKVQIFATDIDESAIATAREGLYTLNDAADVSADRLRRFFTPDGDGYRVRREIREMILFANHNFLKDPPFSKLDLVTCRNVLIYLNSTAQERVIDTFHFALKPKKFLFLGTSESVDGASDLYAVHSRDHHIFQTREVTPRSFPVPDSVPQFLLSQTELLQKSDERSSRDQRISFGELHQRMLEQYAPPSVVVNEEYEIVHMTERAGKYFEFAGGEPTQNLLKLIRPQIRLELRSALYQAVQNKTAVEARNIKLVANGQPESLDIHVRPVLEDGNTAKGFILVVFKPAEEAAQQSATVMMASDEPVARQLEEELSRLKTQLRNSIEQHEYQAEELKASNEELQAMNEELRSAAEELETSKEELQSINEELRTVNQELKVKIDEISITSNNFQNLINSASVGTIFLDRSFTIRLFTPAVLDIFNLKSGDYGRPVTDITNKLQYDGLLQDAETVLEKLAVVEREVTTNDNRFFMMRLLPYRTSEDRISGVVITFFDITRRRELEEAQRQSEERMRLLIESAKDYAIFTLDTERHVVSWSSGTEMILGYTESEMIGKPGDIIFTPEDRERNVPENEVQQAEKEGRAENERWHVRKDGLRFWASGSVSPLRDIEGKVLGFVKIMRDLTEQRQIQDVLRKSEEKYRTLFNSIDEGFSLLEVILDKQGNVTDYWHRDDNPAFIKLTGLKDPVNKRMRELLPGLEEEWFTLIDQVYKTGEPVRIEYPVKELDQWYNCHLSLVGEKGSPFVAAVYDDITERRRAEERQIFLLQLNDGLRLLANPDEIQETTTRLAMSHFKADRSYYCEIEDDVVLIQRDAFSEGLSSVANTYSLQEVPLFKGISTAGKPIVVDDVHTVAVMDESLKQLCISVGIISYINIPVIKNGKLAGNFCLTQKTPRKWKALEIELATEIAERTWTTVEKAKAETALRASEQRLQRMVNVPRVGILTFDYAGTLLHANEAFIKMLGYTDEELNNRQFSWHDFTPPQYYDASLQILEQLKTTKRGGPYEKEYILKDGSLLWIMFVSADLGDGTIVEYAVDISERKKAEADLIKSKEHLQLATHAAKMGTFIYYPQEDRGEPDNQMLFLFGLPLDGTLNLNEALNHIIHPDDRDRYAKNVAQAIDPAGDGKLYSDIRIIHPDGSLHWVNISAQTYFEGNPLRAVKMPGITIDITERKNAQQTLQEFNALLEQEVGDRTAELKESRDLLQSILDNSFIAMSVLRAIRDESGSILDFEIRLTNQELNRETGRTDLVGKIYAQEYPGVRASGLFDVMLRVMATGQPEGLEYFYSYEGFNKWYSCMFVKMDDSLVVTNLDISKPKQAEEHIRKSEEQLRMFVTASSDLIYRMSADWSRMYALESENFLSKTEAPTNEWRARYIPSDEQQKVQAAIDQAISRKQLFELEHRVLLASGKVGWANSRAVPLLNEQGEILEWFGVASNVTARKAYEDERNRNYLLLQQSEELAGTGTWDYDLLTGIFNWSDGMYRLFGLQKGIEVSPDIYLQYATTDCSNVAARITAHIKQGDAEFEETLTIAVGETAKVLKLKALVIKNEEGHPVRMLGVDMDVTAGRHAESRIREMEAEQQLEIFRVTLRTQEEERRRISESLHNGLGQLLYAIKISMNELSSALALQNEKAYASSKQYTEGLLTDAIKESRRISHELMPMLLEEFGLMVAIKDICEQLQGGGKFNCRVELKGVKLDKYFELAVYRIVQELMLNVVKHAEATVTQVDITVKDGKIMIRVKDNGKGLTVLNQQKAGIGLASIRSKANLLNGSVNFTSTPEKGTVVEVWLKIDVHKN